MEKKLRHSRQRDMIYEYLLSTSEHPSAEMVYEHLRNEITNLSLGTVYRNLKLLVDLGKVRRVTTLQNVERYDARRGDHAHFICEQCGCVKDLSVVDTQSAQKNCCVEPGDQVNWMNVVFGGLCAACTVRQ